MSDKHLLLASYLKTLKLPTSSRIRDLTRGCAPGRLWYLSGMDAIGSLLRAVCRMLVTTRASMYPARDRMPLSTNLLRPYNDSCRWK